jgi:hypothetical protein
MGDGSDLEVHQTAVGRIGGLICPVPATPDPPNEG